MTDTFTRFRKDNGSHFEGIESEEIKAGREESTVHDVGIYLEKIEYFVRE